MFSARAVKVQNVVCLDLDYTCMGMREGHDSDSDGESSNGERSKHYFSPELPNNKVPEKRSAFRLQKVPEREVVTATTFCDHLLFRHTSTCSIKAALAAFL